MAAFYEFYATIKHNRSKALVSAISLCVTLSSLHSLIFLFPIACLSQDDLLADVGDSSPLDAVEEGNATPNASSAGTAVVTPQQVHNREHGQEAGTVEALQGSAPQGDNSAEADANSSEASNASAPVSAAPSSADLAQLVSQNEETENEVLLCQQQERENGENREKEGEGDSPMKRARLE